MTANPTGGIGGLPPAPAVDRNCRCCGATPPEPTPEEFAAFWSGNDTLLLTAPSGSTAFNDATSYTITLVTGETVTIPANDPHVNVIDGENVEIVGLSELFPGVEGAQVASFTANGGDEPIGGYDGNAGLAPGQYAIIHATPTYIEELFPGFSGSGSHIQMGSPGSGSCYYLDMWYDCEADRLAIAFNKKDLYGGDVFRTEVETIDGGTYNNVFVTDEWRNPASAWTYGSSMVVPDASTYGLDWHVIRAYDEFDNLICEYTDPQFTWHGGPWNLDQSNCVGGGGDPEITTNLDGANLVITSDPGFFNSVGLIVLQTDNGQQYLYEGSGFTLDDNGQVTIGNAPQYGTEVTQIDFYDQSQSNILQTWTGNQGLLPLTMYVLEGSSPQASTVVLQGGLFQSDPIGPLYFIRLIYDDFSGWDDIYLDAPGGPTPGVTVNYLDDQQISLASDTFEGKTYGAVGVYGPGVTPGGQYNVTPFTVNEPEPFIYSIGVGWQREDSADVDPQCDNSGANTKRMHLALSVSGEYLDLDTGGVRFIHSTGSFDVMFGPVVTEGEGWREIGAGYCTYITPLPNPYGGLRFQSAQMLDTNGDPVGPVAGATQNIDIADIATVGITADGHWRMEYAQPPNSIPGYLLAIACQDFDTGSSGQGVGAYDPNGPNAGANAGQGAVIHQWDNDAIEVEIVGGSASRHVENWVRVTIQANDGDPIHESTLPQWVALP